MKTKISKRCMYYSYSSYNGQLHIYLLQGDVTFGHFCIRSFGRHLVGGQKCIAFIERKELIVSLLTNANDYSSETTIFVRHKHIPFHASLIGVVTGVGEQPTIRLVNHHNTFLTSNKAAAKHN